MSGIQPPARERLFTTAARWRVNSPEKCHEYKKVTGSSDATHTYDSNKT